MSRRRLQAPAPPFPPPAPARPAADLRHGGQYPRSHGQGRTQEADREHEVPGVHGALAPLQVHSGVSTPASYYVSALREGAQAPGARPELLTCRSIRRRVAPVFPLTRFLRLCRRVGLSRRFLRMLNFLLLLYIIYIMNFYALFFM